MERLRRMLPAAIAAFALMLWPEQGAPGLLLAAAAAVLARRELRGLDPKGQQLHWDVNGWFWRATAQAEPVAVNVRCRARFRHCLWLEFRELSGAAGRGAQHSLLFRGAVPGRAWSLLRRRLRLLGL